MFTPPTHYNCRLCLCSASDARGSGSRHIVHSRLCVRMHEQLKLNPKQEFRMCFSKDNKLKQNRTQFLLQISENIFLCLNTMFKSTVRFFMPYRTYGVRFLLRFCFILIFNLQVVQPLPQIVLAQCKEIHCRQYVLFYLSCLLLLYSTNHYFIFTRQRIT